MFSVKFTIKHPAHPEHKLDLEGLVDTGAKYTQVPADLGYWKKGSGVFFHVCPHGTIVPESRPEKTPDPFLTTTF